MSLKIPTQSPAPLTPALESLLLFAAVGRLGGFAHPCLSKYFLSVCYGLGIILDDGDKRNSEPKQRPLLRAALSDCL